MGITSLTYEAPVRRSARYDKLDFELLETAVTLAEQGRPLESLTKVFEHLFPKEKLPNLGTEPFSFTQGSSRVTTKVEGDDIVISVPFVKLPEGGKSVAALRFILTTISSTGQLYQPRLRGDDVYLEFRDRLSRIHPAKIVEVLRRMPDEADDNDDFVVGQFGASPLERAPSAGDLTPDELARSEKIWRAHWGDIDELLKECRRKRSMFFLNELTAYATHRINFALPLSGYLGTRLSEAVDAFNNSDEDPQKRENALAKCIKDMTAVTTEELTKSLGHATYAISPHDEGTPDVISHFLEGSYIEQVEGLRDSGKAMDAALALFSTYTYMLSRFAWDEEIEVALKAGLEAGSGKAWREAANAMLEHSAEIASKWGDDSEDEDEEDDESDGEDGEDGEEEDGADE